MGAGGHNVPLIKDDYGIRKLTPKECFAFQGYPIDKYILPKLANSKLIYASRQLCNNDIN
jgi:DNA (cytosine-5)-methyltransferase 1